MQQLSCHLNYDRDRIIMAYIVFLKNSIIANQKMRKLQMKKKLSIEENCVKSLLQYLSKK